jgi:hypothetical protein
VVEDFIDVMEKTTLFGAWIWQPCLTQKVWVLFALIWLISTKMAIWI